MTLRVENVDWRKARKQLTVLREKVFVCEWRIPKNVEFDQYDVSAHHVLLVDDNGSEIATGRITSEGVIGRIAVVRKHRNPAVYQQLFKALIDIARKQHMNDVSVQCELQGVSYYQQQGFRPVGSVYMDAGTPRQRMACSINSFSLPRVELTH